MDTDIGLESEISEETTRKNNTPIQMGLHSVSNILGTHKQLSLFSDQEGQFTLENNSVLENEIRQFGIDLTDVQSRVMEGILRGFTETAYEGNIPPQTREELANEKYSGKLPDSYKYIDKIPRIRMTQSQLLKWAGVKNTSIGEVERALSALKTLGTRQYCFYYDRLAFDAESKPIKDNRGNWQKEEVSAIDTLFTIKEVRDKKSKALKYYEIVPSSIFLDQRENYFLLIPHNFREEVTNLVGNKKASSYTFRFLLFLRYQFERRRRSKNHSAPYKVRKSWEEIAIALKMPESVYKKNKKRAHKILEEVYSVAKTLGYLSSYERGPAVDILVLRDEKYYTPGDFSFNSPASAQAIAAISDANKPISQAAEYLLKLFFEVRKELDPHEAAPEGDLKKAYLKEFEGLLKSRSPEDIEKLVRWGLHQAFWCSQISNPKKLSQNFSDAWIAMSTNRKNHKETRAVDNREMAKKLLQAAREAGDAVRVEILNKCVEIIHRESNSHQFVEYESRAFKEELEHAAEKFKLPLKL